MKKNKRIEIRINEGELDVLKKKAALSGLSFSDYLRQLAITGKVRRYKKTAPIKAEMVREIAKIGNNLNQIARWCNTHKNNADAEEVLCALVAIEKEIRRVLDVD